MDISVVIPAHNRAHTLPACLESVLAQSVPACEVIVVDDRSTDTTPDVVARFAGRGVRYERLQGGQGAQAARNWGVAVSRGDWIAFQDSDDEWLPEKLQRQVAEISGVADATDWVVHGNGLRRDEASGAVEPLNVPTTSGECLTALLRRPAPLFPTLLVSKLALARAGGLDPDCPAYQEWDTSIRLARRCRFIHIAEPLFIWNWHREQTISKDMRRSIAGYDYILERYRGEIVAAHGARVWRRQKAAQAALALRAGLWDEARGIVARRGEGAGFWLARLCARARFGPRGIDRLLNLAA